jgi:putative endopeptidase
MCHLSATPLLASLAGVTVAATVAAAQGTLPPLKVVDPTFIDRTADACTDFYQYANGARLVRDTIPAAYSSSGVERDTSDRNELAVRSVLEDAAAHRLTFPSDSTPRKLGTFYASCMASAAAEAAADDPIRPWLSAIGCAI